MLDATEEYRNPDEVLDEEWMRIQDPIWGEMKDAQAKTRKLIGEKLEDMEKMSLYIRMEMEGCGVVFPETKN